MRRGFTLAELLITLGIIAVISALLAASIVKLKPDSDKATFLKQYDAVMNITNKIVNNSRLYPICQNDVAGEEKWDCRQHPLFNIAQTSVDGKSVNGTGKYCDLLAMSLSGKKLSDNSCSLNPTYADGAWTPTFTTKNGSEWLVSTSRSAAGDADSGYSASYQTEVYFDLNGAEGPNCLYDKDNCKKPDRFKLLVAADGTTIVADPMGQAYVNTRKNWNKKSLEIADDAVVVANLNVNLKDFALQRCGMSESSPVVPDEPIVPVEPTPIIDEGCTAEYPYKVPGLKDYGVSECQATKTLMITKNTTTLRDKSNAACYLEDWDFEVKAYPYVQADTTVFWGFTTVIGNNNANTYNVQAEIGCKIPMGGISCTPQITAKTATNGLTGVTYNSDFSSDINTYIEKYLGKNNKINQNSNNDNIVRLQESGGASIYSFVKIISGENDERQVVYFGQQSVFPCHSVGGAWTIYPLDLIRKSDSKYVIYNK